MNLLREQCNDRLTFPTSFHLWRRHTGCGAGHVGSVGVRWQPLLHAEVLLQDRYGVRNGSKAIPLFVHTIRPLRKTLSFVGCEVENCSSSRDQANSCFLLNIAAVIVTRATRRPVVRKQRNRLASAHAVANLSRKWSRNRNIQTI